MSSRQSKNLQETGISDKEIAEYLQQHPEFFEKHAELLAELRIPHHSGRAISLIERQVQMLRNKNRELDKKLNNLIQIARENDSLNKRVQKMTLELLSATDLQGIFTTIQESLRDDFQADSVVIRLFQQPAEDTGSGDIAIVSRDDQELDIFNRFFESRKPLCGRLNKEQSAYLFGDNAEHIASAALLPMCHTDCFGMLAIGSRDSNRFHSGMGTLFLTYLGEVIGKTVQPYLEDL
jgi:uncharacterized protein YigA (DUF484 family)